MRGFKRYAPKKYFFLKGYKKISRIEKVSPAITHQPPGKKASSNTQTTRYLSSFKRSPVSPGKKIPRI